MTAQWNFTGEPPVADGGGEVTLVEGSTFCIGAANGDIRPDAVHGLFFRDTRILSRWEIRVDGNPVQPLLSEQPDPFSALFVCRVAPRPGRADSTVLLQRRRYVGEGMREDIILENLSGRGGRADRDRPGRGRLRRPVRGQGEPFARPQRADHHARRETGSRPSTAGWRIRVASECLPTGRPSTRPMPCPSQS